MASLFSGVNREHEARCQEAKWGLEKGSPCKGNSRSRAPEGQSRGEMKSERAVAVKAKGWTWPPGGASPSAVP